VRVAYPEDQPRARGGEGTPLTVTDVLPERAEVGAVAGTRYSHVVTSSRGRRVGLRAASAE